MSVPTRFGARGITAHNPTTAITARGGARKDNNLSAPRKAITPEASGAFRPSPIKNSRSRSPTRVKGSVIIRPPLGKEKADVAWWASAAFAARSGSDPFQVPLAPGVEQAGRQDQNEQDPFQHGVQLQLFVGDRPGEEENGFDIEDDEDQGEDVILDFELDPSVADGLDAAFVRRIFGRIRLARAEQPAQPDRHTCHEESERKDEGDEQPLVGHP